MKTINNTSIKSAPRFVDDTHVQVTKEFAKKASIFGTPEYKLWREIKKDVPEAEMVLKTIKKNADKRVDTRNMTYENMIAYIRVQENATALMNEFQKQIMLSKIQNNPYRAVLAWFMKTFENYDSYKQFFKELAEKETEQKTPMQYTAVSATVEEDA